MKKNRFLQLLLVCAAFTVLFSCKSEEEKYPKTVNIKFDITPSLSPSISPFVFVTTTINNEENIELVDAFPYSKAITQVEVEAGTYVKVTLEDNSDCATGENCDYSTGLSISVDNEVVKTENFMVDSSTKVVFIDYTFE